MEYLDISDTLGAKHALVPLHATQKISKDIDFADFPKLYYTELDTEHSDDAKQLTVADYLQSWLYFGLLSKLTEEELDPREFASNREDGITYVSLGRLAASLERLDPSAALSKQPSMSKGLAKAVTVCGKTERKFAEILIERPSSDTDIILLSINIMLSRLNRAIRTRPHIGLQSITPSTRALRQIALANRWCIHHWSRICREFDFAQSYFLLTIPRRTADTIKHYDCTERVCKAWSVALTSDVVHTEPGCECSITSIPTKKVCRIIRNGGIPMISSRINKDGQVVLKLEPWNSWTPYTAVSHVWADGLGNARQNALPQCQLLRLHKLLKQIPLNMRCKATDRVERLLARRKHLFWLDTLCIPVHDSQEDESDIRRKEVDAMKKTAIDSMGFIYAGAAVVLALDAELRDLPENIDRMSLMSLVVHCGWTTRGWTLQEGSLPETLLFPWTRNQLFDPDSIIRIDDVSIMSEISIDMRDGATMLSRLSQVWNHHALRAVYPGNIDSVESLEWDESNDLNIDNSVSSTFLAVWNNLTSRHTSQPHDLPIILANILRYQASEFSLQTKPLGALLNTLPSLPLSVMFVGCQGSDKGNIADRPTALANIPPEPTTIAATDGGDQMDQPLTDTIEITVNRWIPDKIDGFLNGGATLRTSSQLLTYLPPKEDADTRFYLIRQSRSLPDVFLAKRRTKINPVFLVELVYPQEDAHVLRRLERDASAFYILLEKAFSTSPFAKEPIRSAVYAVLAKDDSTIGFGNPRAYFFCHARATIRTEEHGSDDFSELEEIDAPRDHPREFRIVYSECPDQEQLGKLEADQFKTNAADYRITDTMSVYFVIYLPAFVNAIFTAVVFALYRHEDNVPVLAPLIGVYWLAFALLPFFPGLLKSWHRRRSLSGRFQSATASPAKRRLRQIYYQFSTALIVNVYAQVAIYHAFHVMFIIVMITVGGRVGMMFAFAEGVTLPFAWTLIR